MRSLSLISLCSVLCFYSASSQAGDVSLFSDSEKRQTPDQVEMYRGHVLSVSEIAGRKDFAAMVERLRHQIDLVEGMIELSPRVLDFFRTIPIVVDELACLGFTKGADGKDIEDPKALLHSACYGGAHAEGSRSRFYGSVTVWDRDKLRWENPDPVALARDTNLGIIMVRPLTLRMPSEERSPIIVHELLHAYHGLKMPQGYKNAGVLLHYKIAKDKKLYPADAYLMTNEREFFAVTASAFLHGQDGPMTRSIIKDTQPDYYKYLVMLFGFDPAPAPTASPLALAQ